jgi:predicted DNA-binding transcriptional regulator AlpA
MSFQARRELLVTVAPRYKEAGRKQKSIILNEFIASTGYSRKYAIRLLSQREIPTATAIKRPRSRFYCEAVQEALLVAWAASNYIASKRLAPFLVELVPVLERHNHLELTDAVRCQLMRISPATIDRLLQPRRNRDGVHGISLTRSGKLLKNQIPVRTFADWEDRTPGFFEADLVAHCGWSAGGSFLHTLVLTDIATGWVECLALLHRSGQAVINGLDRARRLIPFPILGVDTDNGSEFINSELISYCDKNKITFTRGRACKKNDQCFVEQKNGVVVRQLIGYDRFEGQRAY